MMIRLEFGALNGRLARLRRRPASPVNTRAASVIALQPDIVERIVEELRDMSRLGPVHASIIALAGMAGMCAGCASTATKPNLLSSRHDQMKVFTTQHSFDVVHATVSAAAKQCWSTLPSGQVMPIGSAFTYVNTGVHREIDDVEIEPGRHAIVDVVIRGAPWPLSREIYMLRAQIDAVSASETQVTTYNAQHNKGQRAFHWQVRRWVNDGVVDCSGIGPFAKAPPEVP